LLIIDKNKKKRSTASITFTLTWITPAPGFTSALPNLVASNSTPFTEIAPQSESTARRQGFIKTNILQETNLAFSTTTGALL
jgi:hypothetical protein